MFKKIPINVNLIFFHLSTSIGGFCLTVLSSITTLLNKLVFVVVAAVKLMTSEIKKKTENLSKKTMSFKCTIITQE